MSGRCDKPGASANESPEQDENNAQCCSAAGNCGFPPAPRILVVDMDRALLGLLEEWLAERGCDVVVESDDGARKGERFDLLLVDVPFPRSGGGDMLRRLAAEHPGTPIFALSSNFFGGVESNGAVARTLGVACVLPKPLTRASLIAAVEDRLLRRR